MEEGLGKYGSFKEPEYINSDDVKKGAVDFRGRPALKSKTGGWKPVPFLLVLEVCEVAAFGGLAANIVIYLMQQAHFPYADAAVITTNMLGTSFITPMVVGFIADAYLGRFPTIVLFAFVEMLGFVFLTLLSYVPNLKATPECLSATNCPHVRGQQYSMLMAGMYLVAIGSGGVRVNLSSHGGDQFDDNDPKEKLAMSSFFNLFFFCLAGGFGIACSFLVYIQEYVSFGLGFALSIALLFLGLSFALFGTPLYRYEVPVGSALTRVAQVLVAAICNRHQPLPSSPMELYEVYDKYGDRPYIAHIPHTYQFKFLDKAAVVQSRQGVTSPWRLCTVTQVEEVKALLRMMPIWATTIMLNVCLAQLQTFSIEQGVTTERRVGTIQIPAASIIIFPVIMLLISSPIYEFVFVPVMRRLTGTATGITYLQRIGVGLFMAVVSMSVAGAVEQKRRRTAEEHGLVDNLAVLAGIEAIPMSIFWLAPQYLAFGIADMFTYVGMLEFFYYEAPDGMRSLGTGIQQSTLALGYFLSSSIVKLVKLATRNAHGADGWLPDNLNRSRLDYFYWFLAVLNILNFALFLICAHYYQYRPRGRHPGAASTAHLNEHATADILLVPSTPATPSPLTPATPFALNKT